MKKLRLLSLAGLFAIGLSATASIPVANVTASHQRNKALSYQDGYNQGYNETLQNKCIDGNNCANGGCFEIHYENNYKPTAERNYANSAGTNQEDYYRGYLDGLLDGYDAPAYCQ